MPSAGGLWCTHCVLCTIVCPFPDCSFDLHPGGSLYPHWCFSSLFKFSRGSPWTPLCKTRRWHCKYWSHRSHVVFSLNWLCPASGHSSMKLSSDGKLALICWPFLKIVSHLKRPYLYYIFSFFHWIDFRFYNTKDPNILSHHFYCLCVTYIYTHMCMWEMDFSELF